MITNAQEFDAVSRQLRELNAQRDVLLRDPRANPFQLHVEVAGVEKMMAHLQEEINAYEAERARSSRLSEEVAGGR